MLLFLSDLHFTDETTAVNVNAETFDLMTWRELQHAFPGHAMFRNFAQLM